MKKALVLLSVIALSACQSTNVQPTSKNTNASSSISENADWKEYRNDKYGIRFSVPSEWIMEHGKELSLPEFTGFTLVTFQSP